MRGSLSMNIPEHLQKLNGETSDAYLIRLFDNRDGYAIDKYTITNLLNEDAESNYDESKWRKDYAQSKRWKTHYITENLDQEQLQAYEDKRIEELKERVRKQDQNREYSKLLRNSARFEKLEEAIIQAVSNLSRVKPLPHHTETFKVNGKGKEGLALLSDWHFGSSIDNTQNIYNKEIFNKRVRKLVDKIIENGIKNNVSTLHIVNLGDMISGAIHVSTRVQANEDLIEQIKYVSEKLAEVINELSYVFEEIKYYNVIGNHARAGKKSEVGLTENYEYLIPWFLEARLSNLDNVEIIVDKDGFIETEIADEKLIFVHGDFDSPDRSVNKLPQLLGYVPHHIFSGHIHHNVTKEHGKTTVHVNSSLMGLDDYAIQGRFSSIPSQKFFIFDKKDGMECEYVIKLNINA